MTILSGRDPRHTAVPRPLSPEEQATAKKARAYSIECLNFHAVLHGALARQPSRVEFSQRRSPRIATASSGASSSGVPTERSSSSQRSSASLGAHTAALPPHSPALAHHLPLLGRSAQSTPVYADRRTQSAAQDSVVADNLRSRLLPPHTPPRTPNLTPLKSILKSPSVVAASPVANTTNVAITRANTQFNATIGRHDICDREEAKSDGFDSMEEDVPERSRKKGPKQAQQNEKKRISQNEPADGPAKKKRAIR